MLAGTLPVMTDDECIGTPDHQEPASNRWSNEEGSRFRFRAERSVEQGGGRIRPPHSSRKDVVPMEQTGRPT